MCPKVFFERVTKKTVLLTIQQDGFRYGQLYNYKIASSLEVN